MEVLDLFSGYGSWSNSFRDRGHKVVTLDIDSRFDPTVCWDILTWKYRELDIEPDIIFASPDCTYFSIARARWGYPEDKLEWTRKLWIKTFEIIDYFNPEYYLIENPVGKARKYFHGSRRIDYCMYDYQYRGKYIKKPTDLWTNIPIEFRVCDGSHEHWNSFVDVVRDKSKRAVIPEGLVMEIMGVVT